LLSVAGVQYHVGRHEASYLALKTVSIHGSVI